MGAGKTTIGKQLARQLRMEFIDSDRVIEERTGADIPLIFEKEGEDGFRNREQAVIDELSMMQNVVIATGGGAVLNEENRRHLSTRGDVVYLSSDLKTLVQRTQKDKNRPLLHGDESPQSILQRLLEQRDPLYRSTASIVIDTSNSSIRNVIKAIIKGLKSNSSPE
jgi:shikimate kinase